MEVNTEYVPLLEVTKKEENDKEKFTTASPITINTKTPGMFSNFLFN